ncbi:MAG: hypothetical protein DRH97_00160 [Chloroflexi bacterium]|nr:MAG: hypothetical protein DRH97_00160 [Chloroflexota bacterium]
MLKVDFKKPFKTGIATFDAEQTAEYIEIQEPNGSMSDYLGELEEQQGFAYANSMKLSEGISDEQIKEATDAKKEDDTKEKAKSEAEIREEEDKEAMIIFTQLTMGKADIKKCYKVLKKILSYGANKAQINGNLTVTKDVVELIPHKELRRLLGYYIVNFTNILD